ncbi:MAG TPA: ferrous iron transporter B [Anaerolineales bacterium]|nr:ferrous iron transporter B [Anaerolineales bacterium]
MRVALIGPPNCGKSTLFNQVAGYKAETGNFHGTTVTFTESRVRVAGEIIELVDLPGTYTLEGGSPAEEEAARYLASHDVDVIISVVDATHLAAGLELTLELLPLKKPLLLALNMMDEAVYAGLRIDGQGLSQRLGIPVLPVVASKGRGVKRLFLKCLELGRNGQVEGERYAGEIQEMAVRHAFARELVQIHVKQGERRYTWRDRLDDVLLHPIWGYVVLSVVLFLFFQMVYGIGKLIEPPLLALFELLMPVVVVLFSEGTILSEVVLGGIQGIAAGAAIVLPYLFPFLFGLGFLEDIGYLPRIAFLMDALMHRIGLHGKAIVPFILGYGCNVPAVMSTRTLEEPRDRYLAAMLATLVPCAARLVVVFGLVAFYLGPFAALGLYLFNMLVIAVTGRTLSNMMPEDTPGFIMEVPPYRMPTWRNMLSKSWFRMREFIVEAWPLLIVGSMILAVLDYFNLTFLLNSMLRPITWIMGLPAETGVALIFGIFRKELSLVMLGQALGTMNFDAVLTSTQMLVYATFVMFYMPCLATLAVLKRELGMKAMLVIAGLTVIIALTSSLLMGGIAAIL